jgi:hypothetical protein
MGIALAAAQLAAMMQSNMPDFDVMERDQQGYATTNGLFAIINTLRRCRAAKARAVFRRTCGSPPVQRLFLGVIDAANRANVAIYTMTPPGFAPSRTAKIRDQVNCAAGGGTGILGSNGSDPDQSAREQRGCSGRTRTTR